MDRLSEMTSVIDVRNQELGVKNETLGTAKKLANLAGDANPSSLNKWRGGSPSDPRLFHFRRYLLALGLDFQIVPKGGSVSRPTLAAGVTGESLTDYTKRLVAIMEKLPTETQKAILGTAMMYEKIWGGGESVSPQTPSAEMGPGRGQATNDQGPQT
jgi:hypothetical protein